MRESSESYVWWFPGSPVRVRLALDVVRRMRVQLQLTSAAAAGEGLLFGSTSAGTTEVLDFQSVAAPVTDAIARLAHQKSKGSLVGYYRIEAGDLRLKESDLALAAACFAERYQVLLLIQPSQCGPPNAGFFFHDSSGKVPEVSLMEFPFEPSWLAGEQDQRPRLPEPVRRPLAGIDSAPVPGTRRGAAWALRGGLALLLFGVGISAGSGVLRQWRAGRDPGESLLRPAAPPPSAALSTTPTQPVELSMGLRARRENGDVEITWKHDSPVITAATSGLLSIREWNDQPIRDISLDRAQLRNASVLYSPDRSQLSISLSVSTAVNTVSESVLLLLPEKAPISSSRPALKSGTAGRWKPFSPPASSVPQASRIAPPQLPPEFGGAPALPAVVAQPIPLLEQMAGAPAGGLPENPAPIAAANYHPPEAQRRVAPRMHPQMLKTIPKPKTLEVRVKVDKTGRVTDAEAVPAPGVQRLVLDYLVKVSRQWTFTPARRGDEPVASEFLLQFHFGP
jgi:hypothetical protein